jgi:hypothetical protein
MDKTSNSGGKTASVMASTFLQSLKQDTSAPRMLTPSEQESLRAYKAEIHRTVKALTRKKAA